MSFEQHLFFQNTVAEHLLSTFRQKLAAEDVALASEVRPGAPAPGMWSDKLNNDLEHAADVLVAAWRYPGPLS